MNLGESNAKSEVPPCEMGMRTRNVAARVDVTPNQSINFKRAHVSSFRPEPGSDTSDANGELTLGGTDSSKYSGSITYFPKLTSGEAAPYWGIDVNEFSGYSERKAIQT